MSGGYPQWSDGGGGGAGGRTSWLLPDYAGSAYNSASNGYRQQQQQFGYGQQQQFHGGGGGGGGDGYGHGNRGFPKKAPKSDVSFDTSAKDPASVRARIFIGSLNNGQAVVRREDVIELCIPFGELRGVTFFKQQGYAFVQYQRWEDAEAACRGLNGVRWMGCVMDAHPVDAPTRLPSAAAPAAAAEKAAAAAAVPEPYPEISFDTSSRDPTLMRARVFIGSLPKKALTRKEIIELFLPFGKLTACTLFKGYAFIQFENPFHAVEACEKVNGRDIKGTKVDVHLAVEGVNGRKRVTEDWETTTTSAPPTRMEWSAPPKKAREEAQGRAVAVAAPRECELICRTCRFSCGDVSEFMQHSASGGCQPVSRTGEPPLLGCHSCDAVLPNAWRMLFHLMDVQHHTLKLVTTDTSPSALEKARAAEEANAEKWWTSVEAWTGAQKEEEGEGEGQPGEEEENEEKKMVLMGVTIVCGACKLVSEDWAEYEAHKKSDCVKPRDPMEPSCLVCTMCQETFSSAWRALFHLVDFHRMKLFYPDHSNESRGRCMEDHARERVAVDRRMKNWADSQPKSASA